MKVKDFRGRHLSTSEIKEGMLCTLTKEKGLCFVLQVDEKQVKVYLVGKGEYTFKKDSCMYEWEKVKRCKLPQEVQVLLHQYLEVTREEKKRLEAGEERCEEENLLLKGIIRTKIDCYMAMY